MVIEVGDAVMWWSSYKWKSGKVAAVVPPNSRLSVVVAQLDNCNISAVRTAMKEGLTRAEESYLVLEPPKGRGKPKLYWPRTAALEPDFGVSPRYL